MASTTLTKVSRYMYSYSHCQAVGSVDLVPKGIQHRSAEDSTLTKVEGAEGGRTFHIASLRTLSPRNQSTTDNALRNTSWAVASATRMPLHIQHYGAG